MKKISSTTKPKMKSKAKILKNLEKVLKQSAKTPRTTSDYLQETCQII
jgi:hypothetical protein